MNKLLIFIFITFILLFTITGKIYSNETMTLVKESNNNLPVIYITSDKLVSESSDKEMLNEIKKQIDGSANVIIDDNSPNPGEAPRAIENAPSGVAAFIAGADAGSINEIVYDVTKGYLSNDAKKLNGIVYINYGSVNLENTSYLPRAFDDNYSNQYFAGLYDPATFLNSSGIILIQPDVGTSSQNAEIKKISSGLIEAANSNNSLKSNYNTGLIAIHQISPYVVAYGSQNVLDGKNPDMGNSRWMYLASQYVSGYPIKNNSQSFISTNVSGKSSYFGVLTINEYRDVGKAVSDYMDENKTVPESINVDGKTFKKSDLEYLFAQLTYNHTSIQNLTFPRYIFINKSDEPFDIIVKYIQSIF